MIRQQREEGLWALSTDQLRLAFSWQQDRWHHLLAINDGADRRAFADSVDDGPPAAVVPVIFQDIAFQTEGNDAVALLLGTSGRHHFAASFRVSETTSGTVVDVDVADRCPAADTPAASVYRVPGRPGRLVATGATWQTDPESLPITLNTEPPPGAVVGLDESLSPLLEGPGWDVRIGPEPRDDPPATRRWRFRWEIRRI